MYIYVYLCIFMYIYVYLCIFMYIYCYQFNISESYHYSCKLKIAVPKSIPTINY